MSTSGVSNASGSSPIFGKNTGKNSFLERRQKILE
jgi:hypothetical protein